MILSVKYSRKLYGTDRLGISTEEPADPVEVTLSGPPEEIDIIVEYLRKTGFVS